MNVRENKLYSTVLAIPDYRLNPSSHTIMTFGETGSGCHPQSKCGFIRGRPHWNGFVRGRKKLRKWQVVPPTGSARSNCSCHGSGEST